MTGWHGLRGFAFWLMITGLAQYALAEPAQRQTTRPSAQTATHVSAEIVKGKLSPSSSKPGDEVAVRLKEDLKSNGEVVMKKGSTITGVVKKVKRVETNDAATGAGQSMIEIEWLSPVTEGRVQKSVMVAVQTISYTNPLHAHEQISSADGAFISEAAIVSRPTAVTSAVQRSNVALLNMPTVMAADLQISAALQNTFGIAADQPIYKTGRGEVVSADGSKQSLDIFSRLSNDTVLTSLRDNFEISSGAQMQLLVGVQR